MTKVFEITIADAGAQTALLDKLKSSKFDVIQTGSGLVAKGDDSILELAAAEGATVNEIRNFDSLAPDVRAFVIGT